MYIHFTENQSYRSQNKTKQNNGIVNTFPGFPTGNSTNWLKNGDNENCFANEHQHQCDCKLFKNLHPFQYFMRRYCNCAFSWHIVKGLRESISHLDKDEKKVQNIQIRSKTELNRQFLF